MTERIASRSTAQTKIKNIAAEAFTIAAIGSEVNDTLEKATSSGIKEKASMPISPAVYTTGMVVHTADR